MMKDGWLQTDYFALAECQQESRQLTAEYGISEALPGYSFIGLIGWNDFILSNHDGRYFRVPTVPLTNDRLDHYVLPMENLRLEVDPAVAGRVKCMSLH